MKQILYYQKENGKIPVKDFLHSLFSVNRPLMTKIFSKLELLSFGLVGVKDTKYIRDGVYELRIIDKNNISRVFYFSSAGDNIVLLDAIIKKDQKLKNKSIERAIAYKKDFQKRFGILWHIRYNI